MVSLLESWIRQIQRPQYRLGVVMRTPGIRIKIRQQLSPKGEVLPHQGDALCAVDPGHAQIALKGILVGTVHTQERTEGAELDPARVQIKVDLAAVKTTDIVTDVGHQHVAAARREGY